MTVRYHETDAPGKAAYISEYLKAAAEAWRSCPDGYMAKDKFMRELLDNIVRLKELLSYLSDPK